MSEYRLNSENLTKKMQVEVHDLVEWLKKDYEDAGEKVGKPKISYEFEEYQERKFDKSVDPDGTIHYRPTGEFGDPFYELVLTIKFPLRYLPFEAKDVHTYRWNERRGEFEHESTDIM